MTLHTDEDLLAAKLSKRITYTTSREAFDLLSKLKFIAHIGGGRFRVLETFTMVYEHGQHTYQKKLEFIGSAFISQNRTFTQEHLHLDVYDSLCRNAES